MISTAEMKKIEDASEKRGISKIQLMENAGKGAFNYIVHNYDLKNKSIFVVCGSGNNGGDGFVLARYLLEHGFSAKVYFLGLISNLKKESSFSYLRLRDCFNDAFSDGFLESDIYIDAMVGTGLKGKIREPMSSAIINLNKSNKTIISLDIPTGLNPDTGEMIDLVVKADKILCFHDAKIGLKDMMDKVTIIDIGIRD